MPRRRTKPKRDKQAIESRIAKIEAVRDDGRAKGKWELLAIARQIKDLKEGHKRGLVWDDQAAQDVIDFFSLLHHWKGRQFAGKKIVLEPVQSEVILAPIFGWKDSDGYRRFREAYIEMGRKGAKTTLAAGVGLYMLSADKEPGAEIYTAATKKEQARICFEDAQRIMSQSSALREQITPYKHSLFCARLQSRMVPQAADYNKADGLNPHMTIFDEVHEHPSRALYDKYDSAYGARTQPLTWLITSAGVNRESFCKEMHNRAELVLSGASELDSFYCIIFAIDEKDNWEDEAVWPKANPLFGITPTLKYLREKFQKARFSPAAQNTFRRMYLTEWTEQEDRWLEMGLWDACAGKVDPVALEGRVCYGGLDLSTRYDLTAFVLVFPPVEDGEPFQVLPFFWIPRAEMLKKEKRDRVPYGTWVRQGFVEATDGNIIDHRFVVHKIEELSQRYNIREIAFDRWGSSTLTTVLADISPELIEFGQGYKSMSPALKELMALVIDQKIAHGGNPVLWWHANSLVVKQDPAGNIRASKPDRDKSSNRIDGMVALVMALDRAIRQGANAGKSVYEERGLVVL